MRRVSLLAPRHYVRSDGRRPYPRSDKIEFSFLNGNLIVSASRLVIFSCDTFPMMEEHMRGESTQILLFLAIVGLTVVSTIDLVMQPIKQQKNTDQER